MVKPRFCQNTENLGQHDFCILYKISFNRDRKMPSESYKVIRIKGYNYSDTIKVIRIKGFE